MTKMSLGISKLSYIIRFQLGSQDSNIDVSQINETKAAQAKTGMTIIDGLNY